MPENANLLRMTLRHLLLRLGLRGEVRLRSDRDLAPLFLQGPTSKATSTRPASGLRGGHTERLMRMTQPEQNGGWRRRIAANKNLLVVVRLTELVLPMDAAQGQPTPETCSDNGLGSF